MRLSRRSFLSLAGAAAAGGGLYACLVEPTWLRVVEREARLERLDPAFDGYRIVQLSDLHVGGAVPVSFLRGAVARANGLGADLAVVTGDILDHGGGPGLLDDALGVLSGVRARDRVLAVLGNHDTGCLRAGDAPDLRTPERLQAALAEAGVGLLRNGTWVLERGRARLAVAGYGDLWSGLFRAGEARAPDGTCTVALSHNPDTAPELARRGSDLILSGHTHGGQVSLPLFGPPYVPVRTPFVHGPYRIGPARLYVNAGLGCSRRIRFGARPELTLLTLRAL